MPIRIVTAVKTYSNHYEIGQGVLAILRDEDPVKAVPHFELVPALDAVTGEYDRFRNITSATVERDGSGLSFTQDSGLGG